MSRQPVAGTALIQWGWIVGLLLVIVVLVSLLVLVPGENHSVVAVHGDGQIATELDLHTVAAEEPGVEALASDWDAVAVNWDSRRR